MDTTTVSPNATCTQRNGYHDKGNVVRYDGTLVCLYCKVFVQVAPDGRRVVTV